MNNKVNVNNIIIIVIILVFFYHKNTQNSVSSASAGEYANNNVYKNISPMKHDIFKQITIDVSALIILGLMSPLELWNSNDPYNSVLGKSFMIIIGYLIFYQLVQPYLINYLPNF